MEWFIIVAALIFVAALYTTIFPFSPRVTR